VPNVNIVNAVSLKLPKFNTGRVEYWCVAAEAEFHIKNITGKLTKSSHVSSSMKGDTIDQIIDLACDPPAAEAYGILKARLLEAFGRTPVEWANAIIDWPGMGNLKPLALYDKMAATLPDGADRDHIVMTTLFMRQLAPDLRDHLADKIG
jgi:hypothetical protein